MESQLEFPKSAILTPYNYFEWKPKIQLHLRSRGLFRITMETEVEPTSAIEKSRYFNRMDEAFGILCLSISPELLFHVESCSTPNEVWKILEGLFGKQDEIWQSFLFSLGHSKVDSILLLTHANEERSVKSHDAADISMKLGESEVHSEELASKQISKKEEKVGGRKSNLRSWVPIRKAFLFPTVPDLHHNSRAELKVSQGSLGGHAKDTEAPAIEQSKAQEFRPENELPDLITAPIDQASKSASISAEVDSEGGQQLTSIGFDRKVSSHARMPNNPFKRQGIESTGSLSSVSLSPQLSLSSPAPSAFGRTLPDFDGNAMASAAM